jgi:hypothetical protein
MNILETQPKFSSKMKNALYESLTVSVTRTTQRAVVSIFELFVLLIHYRKRLVNSGLTNSPPVGWRPQHRSAAWQHWQAMRLLVKHGGDELWRCCGLQCKSRRSEEYDSDACFCLLVCLFVGFIDLPSRCPHMAAPKPANHSCPPQNPAASRLRKGTVGRLSNTPNLLLTKAQTLQSCPQVRCSFLPRRRARRQ